MSEQISNHNVARRILLAGTLLATSLLAESCLLGSDNSPTAHVAEQSTSIPPTQAEINPSTGMVVARYSGSAPRLPADEVIPRCFDKPLSPQEDFNSMGPAPLRHMFKSKAAFNHALKNYFSTPTDARDTSIPINLPIISSKPEGMPSSSPSDTVLNSIVRISTSKYQGSGFTGMDAHGKEVVITAAHIGAKARLKDISITAMNGITVHPNGGCYINESISYVDSRTVESFAQLPKGNGASNIDLSILTIPQTLGTTALGFVDHSASRGDWIQFSNFEIGSSLEQPANFYGLLTSSAPHNAFEALTGISYTPNAYLNRGAPGDSGGLVSVGDRIAGLSFAGNDEPGKYISQEDIAAVNVHFPGAVYGFNTGFAPAEAWLIGSQTIQLALTSIKA